jgi:hypothetical protein
LAKQTQLATFDDSRAGTKLEIRNKTTEMTPIRNMNTITSRITVLPKGESIFSQLATEISIVDEAAGPFIEMRQFPDEGDEQTIKFDVDEWSYIAKAVGKLIQEIEKLKQ